LVKRQHLEKKKRRKKNTKAPQKNPVPTDQPAFGTWESLTAAPSIEQKFSDSSKSSSVEKTRLENRNFLARVIGGCRELKEVAALEPLVFTFSLPLPL
jgi:hypothetical protein